MSKYLFFFALLSLIAIMRQVTAVRVRCNHPERIREDHIHYCCKHPDGHDDITEKCAQSTGFKLPAPNEEAPEDATVEQVARATCWGQCVFEQYKFLKQQELDMDAVRLHYSTVHKLDPEYEREMIDAFDHCHGQSEEATTHFMSSPLLSTTCDPKASVILSCVIYRFFHNCPAQRWSNTTECTETRTFARQCKDALTSM